MDPITDLRRHITAFKNPSRPLVTLTYAQSLDGSISLLPDKPFIISGAESLRLTHQSRAAHDAILVGIGTVLADDPSLTVRHAKGDHPRPIVLDSHLIIPDKAKLLSHPHPLIIATSELAPKHRVRALTEQGAIVLPLPSDSVGIDLEKLLSTLLEMGIHSLMVEGGARVLTSFLRQKLADWAMITIAPYFVGGLRTIAEPLSTTIPSPATVTTFPKLKAWQWRTFGDDLVVWGTLK